MMVNKARAAGATMPRPVVLMLALFAICAPFDTLLNVTPAGTLTRYVGIAVIALGLLEIAQRRAIVLPGREVYAWAAFFGLSSLSILWAINTLDCLSYLTTVFSLLTLLAVVSLIPYQRRDFLTIAAAAIAGGLSLSLYALYVSRHAFSSQNIRVIQGGTRLFLTIPGQDNVADPNHFAASLILPIALAIAFAIRTQSPARRLLCLGAVLILLIGIWETASRGGLAGLCGLMLYFMWRSRARMTFLGISILGAVSLVAIPNRFAKRFVEDHSIASGRGDLWNVGLPAFREHWLFGAGAANFASAYDENLAHASQSVFQNWHRPAHNILLSTAVDLGVVGLLFLAVLACAQWRTLRGITSSSPLFDYRISVEASWFALAIIALFLDMVIFKYVWLTFILAAVLRIASSYQTAATGTRNISISLGRRASSKLGSAAVARPC